MSARRVTAFAPGRVNVIGEHTDYNEGLALPFAIEQGVTVGAVAAPGEDAAAERIENSCRFSHHSSRPSRTGAWFQAAM